MAEQKSNASERPTIVLVHGAFADASGWWKVIPQLQDKGFDVIAVQNPLKSFDDDVETTKRALQSAKGPVILVGHSYGGAVITAAAQGMPQVKGLVYIAAFAPDVGESLGSLLKSVDPTPLLGALLPDSQGYLSIDPAKYSDVFAKDLPADEARILAVTQKPIAGKSFEASSQVAAWKTLPSWYLVASEDRAINPELERRMAKKIGARMREVKSSHVPFLSRPNDVVELILEATRSLGGARKVA